MTSVILLGFNKMYTDKSESFNKKERKKHRRHVG